MSNKIELLKSIVAKAQHIVVVQADNPDGDSLGSALALEHILGDLGKTVTLYCGVDMPGYLQYLTGWDRVQNQLPNTFDASIIVDASTLSLLEKLQSSGELGWLATKPCAILDHHEKVENIVPFAQVIINEHTRSSTGELIYWLAKELDWTVSVAAGEGLMTAILGDTQGLSNQLASADTYTVMAELVASGVDRPALEERRRELSKMPATIYNYKGLLLQRTEFVVEGHIAVITIPQTEINSFSPLYNPAPLIQGDMLQTIGVQVAIVLKHYADGKVTGAIRCNPGYGVGAELAEHLGGGGHAFASGFKVTGKAYPDVKADCLQYCQQLLSALPTSN
ncbi:MAG: DHH family phosphoesterase [Patescibacteria group bacterium]|nr:DHH family phosphoesterase [Patescibacteria group bacterium]